MPWPVFSGWTEEDRHAVVVYLRHLIPIAHEIPEPVRGHAISVPGAVEQDYAGKDSGVARRPQRLCVSALRAVISCRSTGE